MMNCTIRGSAVAVVVCGLALCLSSTSAWAQKGGSGGGGGGGGGGVKVTTTTVPVTMFGTYYGPGGSGSTVAKGSASLTFDASQTSRSFTVSVTNVNLPDGMIMQVEFLDNGLTEPGVYYPVWVTQTAGYEFLDLGAATLSLSTANGDNVPLFGSVGSIIVSAIDPVTGFNYGTVVSGSYNLSIIKGGGGGGGGESL